MMRTTVKIIPEGKPDRTGTITFGTDRTGFKTQLMWS